MAVVYYYGLFHIIYKNVCQYPALPLSSERGSALPPRTYRNAKDGRAAAPMISDDPITSGTVTDSLKSTMPSTILNTISRSPITPPMLASIYLYPSTTAQNPRMPEKAYAIMANHESDRAGTT